MRYPCLDSQTALAGSCARHQRVDGAARLEFRRGQDGVTRAADLYQRAPCRILFPRPEDGDPALAVLLTTSGGLTGGDRTEVGVDVGPRAQATVTTQAAEKIYRALEPDGEAQVRFDVRVAERAWSEILAQETIVFDGARLRRSLEAHVAATGRLLTLETVVFGRTAMGERFDHGLLHDVWRVSRDGRLVWMDAVHLEGDIARLRAEPFGFGTSVAYSTLLYVGPDAAQRIGRVRTMLEGGAATFGASVIDGVLLVRVLSDRPHELRAAMTSVVADLRHAAARWPARLPRIWSC